MNQNGEPPVSTSTPVNGERSYDSLTPNSSISSRLEENGCGPLVISSRSASVASLGLAGVDGTPDHQSSGDPNGLPQPSDVSHHNSDVPKSIASPNIPKLSSGSPWSNLPSEHQKIDNMAESPQPSLKQATGVQKLKKNLVGTTVNGSIKSRNSSPHTSNITDRTTSTPSGHSHLSNSKTSAFASTSDQLNSHLGSESVQMDASLLNASAMAWAALSANPFLFAGGGLLPPSMASVQAAMASLQQKSFSNEKSHKRGGRSRVSDSTSTQPSGRSSVVTDGETSGRSSKEFGKNSVDLTIDDVINKSQTDVSRRGGRGSRGRTGVHSRNLPVTSVIGANVASARGRGRGRGRGRLVSNVTVRQQLALQKQSDDLSDVIGDLSALASVPESFSLSNGCAKGNTQEVALDLSKKGRPEGSLALLMF